MNASAKDTVLHFLKALNGEDFEQAGTYLSESVHFDGVMGQRDGAAAYMADMTKMKFKYEVLKAFEDENDVCVLYNIDMGGGQPIYTAGWYHLAYGKIKNIKVVFDPTPLKG